MRVRKASVLLVIAVLAATALGAYSAIELRRTEATCEQLNEVIAEVNHQGDVIRSLLLNAARTREASSLLPETSPAQRRINQRAAYKYRLDAGLIRPIDGLGC